MKLSFPDDDANGNLLADFLETDVASSIAVAGTSSGVTTSGEPRAYRVDGRFERAPNTDLGTYSLVFTPTGPNATYCGFTLEEKFLVLANDVTRSSLFYERGVSPSDDCGLRLELRDFGADSVTTGSARYHVVGQDHVTVEAVTLSKSEHDSIAFNPFSVERRGNRYVGLPITNDGLAQTPWTDFARWHIEITDANDLDHNGVPDFSDARYRAFDFILEAQPLSATAGSPFTLTADTQGLPFSKVAWLIGEPGGARIPVASSSDTILRFDPLIPLLTPHWSADGPGMEKAMDVQAIVAGAAGIRTVTKQITLSNILGAPIAQSATRGLSGGWDSAPFGYSLTTNGGVTFDSQPVVLHQDLSDGVLVYLAADFQGYRVSRIDGPAFTLHLRAHATIDSEPDGLGLRIAGYGSTANSFGDLRFALIEGNAREIATGVLHDVALGTIPLVVTDDGLNVHVYAGADRRLALEGSSVYRRGHSLAFTAQQRGDNGLISTANISVYNAPWLVTARGSRLSNMSTRGVVGPGEQAMIFGTVVKGGDKSVVVRAIGPSLNAFGVTDAIANPRLKVYRDSAEIATNDDWGGTTEMAELRSAFARVGAFALPDRSKDSAALLGLTSGVYTALVENAASATGSALVELYDADMEPGLARLANLSTRGFVQGSVQPLIAGLVVTGPAARTVLIRGVGMQLRQFGVTGLLANPLLQVFDASGREVTRNDRWNENSNNRALVETAVARLGIFGLDALGDDAALVIVLPPGAYTAQVTGVGSASGIVLLEVYDLE